MAPGMKNPVQGSETALLARTDLGLGAVRGTEPYIHSRRIC